MFFGLEILFACAAFVWLKEVISDWFARLFGGGGAESSAKRGVYATVAAAISLRDTVGRFAEEGRQAERR